MGILGTGDTLTRARQTVICDPDGKEWKGTQAKFRIHRYGQLKDTVVWFLWCLDVLVEPTFEISTCDSPKIKEEDGAQG